MVFQYPVFGSSVCNWFWSEICYKRRQAFSTLCSGRVSATLRKERIMEVKENFQYPVFGSSVCNLGAGIHWRCNEQLSVPCVRVECLQPRGRAGHSAGAQLSVPCVRVECLQRSPWSLVYGGERLSVPCVRVECLQLIEHD